MEANLPGKAHHSYGPVVPNLKALGKKSMEWDLNDWKWDGDRFSASPLNSVPSDGSGRQLFNVGTSLCPDENGISLRNELEKRDLEKRRRDVVVDEEELENNGPGSLNLKLGGQVYPITEADIEKWNGKIGKKSKIVESSSNRAVCQVDDCRADLTYAKDYHRRHKVCETHSKAGRASVGNVMQRFCQQCSRFHLLEEFDEGKRSCRRRLAGHNKRRRKTNPENIVNAGLVTDERSSSYLLVSLLRILANMHANSSDQTKDQGFISHLLKNLAGSSNGGNTSMPLDNTKNLHAAGTSTGTPEKEPLKPNLQHTSPTLSSFGGIEKRTSVPTSFAIQGRPENAGRRMKLHDIDLNNVYDDSQDCEENLQTCPVLPINGSDSPDCTRWGHQTRQKSSPPQTSRNSGSLSTLSPSSSSGEAQSLTDRIVFKLFGKDPNDFPLLLRKQILEWLSNSPTDIESYIRPGCIVLTMYLRLRKSTWEEICCDLSSSLTKLLEGSEDSFWKVGWVYTRLPHHVAFINNGEVVLDTVLPLRSHKSCSILSIKPIAVSVSKRAQFSVKGFNLSQSTTRLLCAFEGKYLAQETSSDGRGDSNMSLDNIEIQCLSFSCSIPNIIGRGFIEVEDQCLNSSFFPFIVAEQDVCTEICTLESSMEIAEVPDCQPVEAGKSKARDDAMEFVHEMGWLLHRTQLMFRHGPIEPNLGLFPFKRFRWLMEYSVEHDWCAVVKKLLDVVFDGIVDSGDYPSIELALLDMDLLHTAVRRNCRAMVENLLKYVPEGISDGFNGIKLKSVKGGFNFLFRPDAIGPGDLTPLHVAASKEGSEKVLDALTDDPGLVGIGAWKGARDSTGLTPSDHASLRGYYSYINLVQKKINKISSRKEHVVLDIEKATGTHKSKLFASFNTEKNKRKQIYQLNCKLCEQKMAYANSRMSLAVYRPAILSMLAIATVCVCAALLFKSSPKVDYVLQPFRWETLGYGYI